MQLSHYIQHGKLYFSVAHLNTSGNIPQLLVCLGICGIDGNYYRDLAVWESPVACIYHLKKSPCIRTRPSREHTIFCLASLQAIERSRSSLGQCCAVLHYGTVLSQFPVQHCKRFWRENLVAVVILLRVLARMS